MKLNLDKVPKNVKQFYVKLDCKVKVTMGKMGKRMLAESPYSYIQEGETPVGISESFTSARDLIQETKQENDRLKYTMNAILISVSVLSVLLVIAGIATCIKAKKYAKEQKKVAKVDAGSINEIEENVEVVSQEKIQEQA